MSESPFRSGWYWFGFDGEPEPGIDYSWTHIQDFLTFDGTLNSIPNCSIFASSRLQNKFLIRCSGMEDEIWDISECLFTPLPQFSLAIKITNGHGFFHLWGASNSLIKILVNCKKMPSDALIVASSPNIITQSPATACHFPRPPSNI